MPLNCRLLFTVLCGKLRFLIYRCLLFFMSPTLRRQQSTPPIIFKIKILAYNWELQCVQLGVTMITTRQRKGWMKRCNVSVGSSRRC